MSEDEEIKKYAFYKKNENDKIWWLDNYDVRGHHIFNFDKVNTLIYSATIHTNLQKSKKLYLTRKILSGQIFFGIGSAMNHVSGMNSVAAGEYDYI